MDIAAVDAFMAVFGFKRVASREGSVIKPAVWHDSDGGNVAGQHSAQVDHADNKTVDK